MKVKHVLTQKLYIPIYRQCKSEISKSASVEGRWRNVVPKSHLQRFTLTFQISDFSKLSHSDFSPGQNMFERDYTIKMNHAITVGSLLLKQLPINK